MDSLHKNFDISDIIPGELIAPPGGALPEIEGDPIGPKETGEVLGCV